MRRDAARHLVNEHQFSERRACCLVGLSPDAYPQAVRTDRGPEFTSRAFLGWARRHGIKHILIEPGAPTQNGHIESFNGEFPDECLNEHWFETLAQARVVIQAWTQDYNEVRPHSSIGRSMPPRCFARLHRQQAADAGAPSTAALAIPLTSRTPSQ